MLQVHTVDCCTRRPKSDYCASAPLGCDSRRHAAVDSVPFAAQHLHCLSQKQTPEEWSRMWGYEGSSERTHRALTCSSPAQPE